MGTMNKQGDLCLQPDERPWKQMECDKNKEESESDSDFESVATAIPWTPGDESEEDKLDELKGDEAALAEADFQAESKEAPTVHKKKKGKKNIKEMLKLIKKHLADRTEMMVRNKIMSKIKERLFRLPENHPPKKRTPP
ncbi:unnamed protein product [Polarella glacialis]|uniref:Uncharacterized protein n=1 Tax=Polarella glacialis TaxID=89957 RepID=A0A813F0H9_POLGL|nr:unnamed protein product [Polarella glacialis]